MATNVLLKKISSSYNSSGKDVSSKQSYSLDNTICGSKKNTLHTRLFVPKTAFNTLHHLLDGRLGYLVVSASSILPPGQKTAMLHHPQMLRGHVAGDITGFGQLANRQLLLQHQLHHPQPNRMGQGPQTFGGLVEILKVGLVSCAIALHVDIISEYRDMSI